MVSTLVVAATEAEAAHVPRRLDVLITGIGKVQAAAATARALARHEPGSVEVINIGSAGALRDGLHGLFEPGVVINHEVNAEVLRTLGHDPQEQLVIADSEIILATGDVFVTDPVVRDLLAERAHLVDMEGYAVVWAARQAGAEVRMVKHVSDQADETAMEWPQLVDASARELGHWLDTHL